MDQDELMPETAPATASFGHPFRASITPVRDGAPRPLWSVMIPTYNCARYLRGTLESVLAQDPGPDHMQIEVVDDSSQDDPAAVVAEVGRDRVGFFRQPVNVGHTANFATCLQRSRGRLVHLLHGDDAVRDGFYQKMQKAFECQPEIGAAFCRHIFMDEMGHWHSISPLEQGHSGLLANSLEHLATEQRIMTPSIVVRRDVYEQVGGFDRRLVCTEDWEMWIRIAAQHPIWYEVEPLALYRMHADSNTGRHLRSGQDARYTRMAIEIFKAYLPPARADEITRRARNTYAASTLHTARSMLSRRDHTAMLRLIRETLLFSHSPAVVQKTFLLLLRAALMSAKDVVSAASELVEAWS